MDDTTTASTLTVSVERELTLLLTERELVLYYSQRANTLTHRELTLLLTERVLHLLV